MTTAGRRSLAAGLACGLAFALLASLAFQAEAVRHADAWLLWKLSAHPEWTGAARLVAHLGDPLPQAVLVGLFALLAARRRRWDLLAAGLVLVLGAALTTQALKPAFAISPAERFLPYAHIGGRVFPSGHTTAVAAVTLAFLLLVPRRWLWPAAALALAATAAVGLAVVVLHRHSPSDSLAACLVALTWFFALAAVLAARRGERPPAHDSSRLPFAAYSAGKGNLNERGAAGELSD